LTGISSLVKYWRLRLRAYPILEHLEGALLRYALDGGADLRISGPSYTRTFVYSKHFRILKLTLKQAFKLLIRSAVVDLRIQ
jgi:hypothetical protein